MARVRLSRQVLWREANHVVGSAVGVTTAYGKFLVVSRSRWNVRAFGRFFGAQADRGQYARDHTTGCDRHPSRFLLSWSYC